MTAGEILQTLDARFEVVHHDPPHLYQLWTHFYPADTRLTAFRSAERWALVFEILGYWCGPQSIRLDVYVYGSGFAEQSAHYETTPLRLLDARSGIATDGTGAVDPGSFSVLWDDQRYDFTPTSQDYSEAGIAFDPARADPDAHANAQIVRYLCERLSHPFFLPEEEMRALLTQNQPEGEAPDTMIRLLQTHSWRHPDLSQEELPSQIKSFQILAHALETGDASAWDHQDPASFNTDWRIYDWAEKSEEEQQREWTARRDTDWNSLPTEVRERIAVEAGAEEASVFILPPHTVSHEDMTTPGFGRGQGKDTPASR